MVTMPCHVQLRSIILVVCIHLGYYWEGTHQHLTFHVNGTGHILESNGDLTPTMPRAYQDGPTQWSLWAHGTLWFSVVLEVLFPHSR